MPLLPRQGSVRSNLSADLSAKIYSIFLLQQNSFSRFISLSFISTVRCIHHLYWRHPFLSTACSWLLLVPVVDQKRQSLSPMHRQPTVAKIIGRMQSRNPQGHHGPRGALVLERIKTRARAAPRAVSVLGVRTPICAAKPRSGRSGLVLPSAANGNAKTTLTGTCMS